MLLRIEAAREVDLGKLVARLRARLEVAGTSGELVFARRRERQVVLQRCVQQLEPLSVAGRDEDMVRVSAALAGRWAGYAIDLVVHHQDRRGARVRLAERLEVRIEGADLRRVGD